MNAPEAGLDDEEEPVSGTWERDMAEDLEDTGNRRGETGTLEGPEEQSDKQLADNGKGRNAAAIKRLGRPTRSRGQRRDAAATDEWA